ncbi:hypothetical protein CAEBREN_00547 [Caenorhabditis brenneri]|uniref:Uncharacterized protein n=1 Tax=Caenorhabditis brenneri TaxID=135651 RepID=G0PAW5_CAEBE|nr:hypothetical protein CAEBREN_00547 [Caenorhabditis brenneri]
MVKDEASQAQGAPELAEIAWEDRESKQILQYSLHHRLHFEFIPNKDQVDLKRLEPFEHTDTDFENWTSPKNSPTFGLNSARTPNESLQHVQVPQSTNRTLALPRPLHREPGVVSVLVRVDWTE